MKDELTGFEAIAEHRIRAAIDAGAFDNLPGVGKPLTLDDDALVPPPLRMAYRVLRNAGLLPPEIEARRERQILTTLLLGLGDGAERSAAVAKLALLEARLETMGRSLRGAGYGTKLFERLVSPGP